MKRCFWSPEALAGSPRMESSDGSWNHSRGPSKEDRRLSTPEALQGGETEEEIPWLLPASRLLLVEPS